MKKLLIFIKVLLLSSVALAEGPLFKHQDPVVQQEFENVYSEFRKIPYSVSGVPYSVSGSSWCIDSPSLCVDVVNNLVTQASTTVNGSLNPLAGTVGSTGAPCTGCVGEVLSSTTVNAVTGGTDAVAKDMISLTLTAGVWDVSLMGRTLISNGGTTWTQALMGIGTVTGNDTTGVTLGDTGQREAHASSSSSPLSVLFAVTPKRYVLTTTTTLYVKIQNSFSAGAAPVSIGRIEAVRN